MIVIFDYDGTLANTEESYYHCMRSALKKYANNVEFEKIIHENYGLPGLSTMSDLGITKGEQEVLTKKIVDFMRSDKYKSDLFIGIHDSLKKLASRNVLALATSRSNQELQLDQSFSSIKEYFSVIVTSDAIEHSKPYPDSLELVLRLTNEIKSRAYYIGDTTVDAQCANAANIRFVLAGWNNYAKQRFQQYSGNINYCAKSPEDLVKFVNGK